MKKFSPLFFFFLLLPMWSVGVEAQPLNENRNPEIGRFLIKSYYADISDLEKVYIFPNSKEYFDRFDQFYANWKRKVQKIDFNRLSQENKVDLILLYRNIKSDAYQLSEREEQWGSIKYALPFQQRIIALQQKRRRGNTLNAQKVAETMRAVQTDIEQAQKLVAQQPLGDEDMRRLAVRSIQNLRKGLKNVFDFYNGYDPAFTWWMKETYPKTDQALEDYAKWISKQAVKTPGKAMDDSGIIGHPIGKKELERQLSYQLIPYSPEDLIKIAKQDYDWTEKEMIKASKEMGYGKDWKAALEKVKEDYLKPGEQPERIANLEYRALNFVDSLNLVHVPDLAKEVWRMDMLTPEQMQFASYFLGGPKILVAYPHESQGYETKEMIMRSGNEAFANAEVFHELIPGHNLQFFMGRRYKSYRQHFSSPFSVEGWAFYWEMLFYNHHYQKTPEEKIGALFWRMTRSARIVFSLNYHLGNWTPQQCIDYLVDKVGLERFSAESEVRRSFTGGYGPLYQLAYMLGALQIYHLHQELVDSGKMSDADFNDQFLREGTIPIELFRALLTKSSLKLDYRPHWKFMQSSK